MALDSNTTSGVQDPEFDAPRALARRPRGPVLMPQETQRLLANPFLSIALAFFGDCDACLRVLGTKSSSPVPRPAPGVQLHRFPPLSLPRLRENRVPLPLAIPRCERVSLRRLAGSVRRWRGPTPVVQTILWAYALLAFSTIVVSLILAIH